MLEQLNCIALRTIKHSDRNSILTVYTRQYGRTSLLLPAGNSRTAARLRAITMPLGRFDCIADIRNGRDLHTFRDVRAVDTSPAASPAKCAVSIFLADLLASLLREPQQDKNTFDFIALSAKTLGFADAATCANFHICFLVRLQHFLGIEPDWATFADGRVFDIADGIFRTTPPVHGKYLTPDESRTAFLLRRMNYRNAHLFAMSRTDRNTILDRLMHYYRTHFPELRSCESLAVLRSMFDF